jgi:phosphoenolpyruvate carboxykinase (ATP)
VFNLENGVYPIVLGVGEDTEPILFNASFTDRPPQENRAIFQNTVVGPDGKVDIDSSHYTENTRVSVPMDYIRGAKESKTGEKPPDNIFFITKDVGGVLPPMARLEAKQAMFWFLMGPTSTTSAEVGGKVGATFSRFFGAPFMSAHPEIYMKKLDELIDKHAPSVWLINTGYTGGPKDAGGQRISIPDTKAMVGAALSGNLDIASQERFDERFKLWVPTEISGSASATALLNPRETWQDPAEYDTRADEFAKLFMDFFKRTYADDPKLAPFEEHSPQPL